MKGQTKLAVSVKNPVDKEMISPKATKPSLHNTDNGLLLDNNTCGTTHEINHGYYKLKAEVDKALKQPWLQYLLQGKESLGFKGTKATVSRRPSVVHQ